MPLFLSFLDKLRSTILREEGIPSRPTAKWYPDAHRISERQRLVDNESGINYFIFLKCSRYFGLHSILLEILICFCRSCTQYIVLVL